MVQLHIWEILKGLYFDDVDSSLVGIDLPHHKIHEGETWKVIDPYTFAGAGTRIWKITTGAVDAHLVIRISSNVAYRVTLYENPTLGTATWTDKTSYNCNRNSSNAAITTVKQENVIGTYNSGTTIIADELVGSAAPSGRFGGTSRSEAEIILKRSEDYGLHIVATGAGDVSPVFEWYEV